MEKQVARTLNLFGVARYGLRGLAQALLAPAYLMLLLCVAALGQDQSVRVTQTAGAAASSATLALAGSLAHIASAGGWDTSLTLVNLGTATGEARLSFYGNDGNSWL